MDRNATRDTIVAILLCIGVVFMLFAEYMIAAICAALLFGLAAGVATIKLVVEDSNTYYVRNKIISMYKNGDDKYKVSFLRGKNIWIMYDKSYKRLIFSFGLPNYRSNMYIVKDYSENV